MTVQDRSSADARLQQAVTALLALSLARLVAPPLLRRAGLPPLPTVARILRPYGPAAVATLWAWCRATGALDIAVASPPPAPSVAGGGSGGGGGPAGILDLWIVLLRLASGLVTDALGDAPPALRRAGGAASALLNDVLGLLLFAAVLSSLRRLRRLDFSEAREDMIQGLFEFAERNVPLVREGLAKEEEKMRRNIERELKDPNRTTTTSLPKEGWDTDRVLMDMRNRAGREDAKWKDGLVSGTVYSGEEAHTRLLNAAYATYCWSNPLHADVWPSVNQYEAEVAAMTASLLNGGDRGVAGAVTSGGTESIILAVRASLEYFGRRRGIARPEVVCCTTAHAALDKVCELAGVRMVRLRPDPVTFRIRPRDAEGSITSDTVLIYASAPSYPQGTIDPVEELSDIAQRYGVGLHVDACLGGFVLPFARKLGYDIPKFDFGCPGVTSMSVDTHKYGYTTKGTSVVLYRNKELRRSQYFAYPRWAGGLYSTPTIAGSRAGGLLACAWASLVSIGENGYLERVKSIMDATMAIAAKVERIPGLKLMGGFPKAMIVCFGSDELDIYRVCDVMSAGGWSLNTLQRPACAHLCVTLQTVKHADRFVEDLGAAAERVRKEGKGDGKKGGGNAAVYGMAGSLPPGPVASLLRCYTDALLTP